MNTELLLNNAKIYVNKVRSIQIDQDSKKNTKYSRFFGRVFPIWLLFVAVGGLFVIMSNYDPTLKHYANIVSWIWGAILIFSLVFIVPEIVVDFKNNSEQTKMAKRVADFVSTKDFSEDEHKNITNLLIVAKTSNKLDEAEEIAKNETKYDEMVSKLLTLLKDNILNGIKIISEDDD